jgi:hypothetical protein
VRRETISAYLRGAGVEIWPPGRWRRERKAKPAIEVITGSDAAKPAIPGFAGLLNPTPNPENLSTKGKATSKPAIEVITDFGVGLSSKEPENSKSVVSAITCEPYREIIELGLSRDRNAMAIWQDLVSDYGFQSGYQSVRRFAYKLRGTQVPQARAVILTAPGEEGQVDYGSGPMVREAPGSQYRRTRLFVLTLRRCVINCSSLNLIRHLINSHHMRAEEECQMGTDEKIIKNQSGVLNLSEMLGSVSEACQVIGYS